jgi:hypothetical protein
MAEQPALELLTTVPSSAEAVMVAGDLEALGVRAVVDASSKGRGIYGTPAPLDIFVEAHDLERAREVLNAQPMSEEELLEAEEQAGD